MALLTRDDLLKKQDFKIAKVEIDSENFVYVRQMNGRERDRFEQSIMQEVILNNGKTAYIRAMEDFRSKLAVNTVCDEEGNLILLPTDFETLSQNITALQLEKIINVAQRLSKITEKDRDNLLGNSEGGKNANSISA